VLPVRFPLARGLFLALRIARAKAHYQSQAFSRSAEALLPPHKCGGSHQSPGSQCGGCRRMIWNSVSICYWHHKKRVLLTNSVDHGGGPGILRRGRWQPSVRRRWPPIPPRDISLLTNSSWIFRGIWDTRLSGKFPGSCPQAYQPAWSCHRADIGLSGDERFVHFLCPALKEFLQVGNRTMKRQIYGRR
jgi:hypothetical protein